MTTVPNMTFDIHFFRQFSNLNRVLSEEEESCHGVMVVLVVEDEILLMRRSFSMPSHKGQVALIGGHRHADEAFPIETARREFLEETALPLEYLELITTLPVVYTARDMPILPVLAYYQQNLEFVKKHLLSNGEWEVAFTVKLAYLFNDANWVEANRISKTQVQNLLFNPLFEQDINLLKGTPAYPFMLWGASARVVENLSNLILTKS